MFCALIPSVLTVSHKVNRNFHFLNFFDMEIK